MRIVNLALGELLAFARLHVHEVFLRLLIAELAQPLSRNSLHIEQGHTCTRSGTLGSSRIRTMRHL